MILKQNGKTGLSLAILLATAMAASVAHARYGFFAEVGAGLSRYDIFEDISSVPVEEEDKFFSIGGGYDFNKKLALEGGYIDLGETDIYLLGGYTLTTYADGFYFGPRLTLELSPLVGAYGRIGMFAWDAGDKDNVRFSKSVEGTDFYFGIGATFKISDRSWLMADWTRYTIQAREEFHVDTLGAKLKFDF
jgi:OOP family OmpA-OmpF porin